MRLLLDTHALLWWHDQPARLTETAYGAISDLGNDIWLRVVNGWEIQIKVQLGKLTLPKPLRVLLQEEQAMNGFRVLPITLEHVYALDGFPLHHRDQQIPRSSRRNVLPVKGIYWSLLLAHEH